ncbi:MAG: LysR family transcriptional regulator [Candidatus Lokiarchaeota archaeon]|nr:LysR family transcriptional regulator [Candidatus Lokiarchaeota archaeon]
MKKIRTRFIRNFIKLTQYKRANFSKLASDLSISQSTLSNQIFQLEKELGVMLIDRTTRSFNLTRAGEIFLRYAEKIVEIEDEAIKELSELKQEHSETILISASTLPGTQIIPKFLANFKLKNTLVNFKVVINNSQRSINLLQKDNVDFAGIGSYMNQQNEEFDHLLLGTDELVFICSPHHELVRNGADNVLFSELVKFPYVSRERGSGTRNIIENQFKGYTRLQMGLEINDNDSIVSTVTDSSYIAIVSKKIAKKAEKAGLIKIITVKEYPTVARRNIYLLKLKNKELTKIKQDFWDYIMSQNA